MFQEPVKIPGGAAAAAAAAAAGLTKPTRYHYYPHNQHIYLLPECAIQQVHAHRLYRYYECNYVVKPASCDHSITARCILRLQIEEGSYEYTE